MTWEGGWDYSCAFLMRAGWGLDHTTPHHTTPQVGGRDTHDPCGGGVYINMV